MALQDFKPKTNTNLFGEEIKVDPLLRDKFIEPPFTTLDTRSGSWQSRKRKWGELGIKSELGRDAKAFHIHDWIEGNRDELGITGAVHGDGVSIFDPALTELMYTWFVPENGTILDPFAGGSVRGIVASYLGYTYTGIELRAEQVDSNREQAELIVPRNEPMWICGDSDKELDNLTEQYDFIFSCPPYVDLEVYSDHPDDLSTMDYRHFIEKYRSIIAKSVLHLKTGGYAVFVVGEVRDKHGNYYNFVGDTVKAFIDAGAKFYNEAILLNSVGSAAMRANKQFMASRKLVKVHQNVLCFKK